jgi:hypothetical protein
MAHGRPGSLAEQHERVFPRVMRLEAHRIVSNDHPALYGYWIALKRSTISTVHARFDRACRRESRDALDDQRVVAASVCTILGRGRCRILRKEYVLRNSMFC